MSNQQMSFLEKHTKRPYTSRLRKVAWTLIILVAICFLSYLTLYYINTVPHYIIVPIQPPADRDGQGFWLTTTYSTFTYTDETPFISPRIYIWRRSSYVSTDPTRHLNESWDSIVSYFDANLSRLSWIRSEIDAPCDVYIPEAKFLNSGENGYIHYFKKGDEKYAIQGQTYKGDLLCLAIWNSDLDIDHTPGGFDIVMLTARQSPFTNFFDIFSD